MSASCAPERAVDARPPIPLKVDPMREASPPTGVCGGSEGSAGGAGGGSSIGGGSAGASTESTGAGRNAGGARRPEQGAAEGVAGRRRRSPAGPGRPSPWRWPRPRRCAPGPAARSGGEWKSSQEARSTGGSCPSTSLRSFCARRFSGREPWPVLSQESPRHRFEGRPGRRAGRAQLARPVGSAAAVSRSTSTRLMPHPPGGDRKPATWGAPTPGVPQAQAPGARRGEQGAAPGARRGPRPGRPQQRAARGRGAPRRGPGGTRRRPGAGAPRRRGGRSPRRRRPPGAGQRRQPAGERVV